MAAPRAPDSDAFVLSLADALSKSDQRVWLVETGTEKLTDRLGCRPLLPCQTSRPLETQVIDTGSHGLLYAPRCMAGDASIASAAKSCSSFDVLLFDGGRFSLTEAAVEPATEQFIVVLFVKEDAETVFALMKTLNRLRSPARVMLIGEGAAHLAQSARQFGFRNVDFPKIDGGLSQINNTKQETSSNTLTIVPNLGWVVSRITENNQSKVAHGGFGESAKESY